MTGYAHLHPQHAALLQASRISSEVAVERGYTSLDSEEALTELSALGFADWQIGSGLLVPLHDVHGENGAYQLRRDDPPKVKGKPQRYLTPKGQRNRLDILPSMRHHLANPETALCFTEGCRKADSMVSEWKVAAITLTGIWCWRTRTKDKRSIVLPDFDVIPFEGRRILLIWDSDAATNPEIMQSLTSLAIELRSRGANVEGYIPPEPPEAAA